MNPKPPRPYRRVLLIATLSAMFYYDPEPVLACGFFCRNAGVESNSFLWSTLLVVGIGFLAWRIFLKADAPKNNRDKQP